MFFPEAMTEVQLIVPSKDLLAVTNVLGHRGVFHQIDSTYLGLENVGPSTWQEKSAAYSALERRIQMILQALNLEEEYHESAGFDSRADLDAVRSAVERIEADVKATSDQWNAEKKRLDQLTGQLHQLEPIADLNVEVGSLRKSRYLYSVPGIIPASNVSRLETSLARVPHVFFTLNDDPQKPVVWILGPRSHSDVIDRAVKSAYLNPLVLPDEFEGTPAKVTESIRNEIGSTKQRISNLDGALAKLADTHKSELYGLLWDVHVNRMTAEAIARFGQLRHTYVVVGWVPTSDLQPLTQRLRNESKEILIEATAMARAGHHSNVPVALHNPTVLRPFEMLVNTYARPRYEEIDPTIVIAVTFPLLYGAMFGDVGHGLVLAGIGWLISTKRIKALRGMASLGGLMIACGLFGVIFGFLFGSIFGFEDVLPSSPFFKHFLWMQPLHNIILTLGIAVGLGVVLLSIGFLLNLYNAWRARDWGRLFFDSNGLAGLVLYWSLLGLAATFFLKGFPVPAWVCIVLVILGLLAGIILSEPLKRLVEGHRPLIEGGVGMFIVQTAAELFEKSLSIFSNTMSYVRVGAFAVAHAGFCLAVFVFAGLASGGTNSGFGYWAMVVVGNIGIVLMEGFIVFIQTMRLHFYEFFSKFFSGGGSSYEPLTLPSVREN
ncbi:MAG TPA: V-type ATPase 116kDa subunit family protein [Anaerolineales bacterium]|nr:V-type ATPase 116kDa subunit family protein [Anaerolineales bacterium]